MCARRVRTRPGRDGTSRDRYAPHCVVIHAIFANMLQFLKTNYLEDRGQLARDAPEFTDADIEDAMAFQQEETQIPEDDDMMMDEDDQLEAMLASYQDQTSTSSQRPPSPALSDEDYDDIFAELIAQEQSQQSIRSRPLYRIDEAGDTEME